MFQGFSRDPKPFADESKIEKFGVARSKCRAVKVSESWICDIDCLSKK